MQNLVEVKYFTKAQRVAYIAVNAIIFLLIMVLALINSFTADRELNIIYAIIGLSLFFVLVVMNLTLFIVVNHSTKVVHNSMQSYLQQRNYNECIEFFRQYTSKKRHFSTNQIVLFYLGYLELMQENTSNAKHYFEQVNVVNCSSSTAFCACISMSLLYIIYTNNKEKKKYANLKQLYKSQKTRLLRLVKRDKEVLLLLNVVDSVGIEGQKKAVIQLKNTRFEKIPLIKNIMEGQVG